MTGEELEEEEKKNECFPFFYAANQITEDKKHQMQNMCLDTQYRLLTEDAYELVEENATAEEKEWSVTHALEK